MKILPLDTYDAALRRKGKLTHVDDEIDECEPKTDWINVVSQVCLWAAAFLLILWLAHTIAAY